ncbi:MAG TPA: hypothetical protein VE082_01395 [Desulfobaccales bacterium]|nr:hypothetical protein [Desulfobaccales bacterium]
MQTKTHQGPHLTESAIGTLELDLPEEHWRSFSSLLQKGIIVRLAETVSVKNFLCRHLGLDPEFVEHVITTIFLNGKPVDNLDQARLGPGDTLALSAAMPGLVGATMRRQGLVASFRSNISYLEPGLREEPGEGVAIVLKLFNLMIEALGPALLKQGILIRRGDWEAFLKRLGPGFWGNCRAVKLNGQKVHPGGRAPLPWPANVSWINLKVNSAG